MQCKIFHLPRTEDLNVLEITQLARESTVISLKVETRLIDLFVERINYYGFPQEWQGCLVIVYLRPSQTQWKNSSKGYIFAKWQLAKSSGKSCRRASKKRDCLLMAVKVPLSSRILTLLSSHLAPLKLWREHVQTEVFEKAASCG